MPSDEPDYVLTSPAFPVPDDGVRLVQLQDKWGRLIYHSNGAPVLVPPDRSLPGRDRAAWAIWFVFWIQVIVGVVLVVQLGG